MESLRIFLILLYKCWLVRKRHWIATLLVEILIPIGLILCSWRALGDSMSKPTFIKEDSHYPKYSLEQLIDDNDLFNTEIYYAPNNAFVNQLMIQVKECSNNKLELKGYNSEADILIFQNTSHFANLVVIFDESTDFSTKHLRYKFRTRYLFNGDLYNNRGYNLIQKYLRNAFVQTQICLDKSFVEIKSDKIIPKMYIQQMPYPAHYELNSYEEFYRSFYCIFLVIAFMFPLFVETARATNEKLVGMNVLMSMNGISNTLNLLSWVISGLILLSVFCVIPTVLVLTSRASEGEPFMVYGNTFILFLTLFFYTMHILTFGVHLSAYFSKALLVIFLIMILSILPIGLMIFVFKDDNLYLAPYVGIIFPNILLYQAVQEIRTYEVIAKGVQWSNLFVNANPMSEIGGSMGMILILFVIGVIFHFTLAIYVCAIKPGEFGVGKHPLFFLMYKNKRQTDERIEDLVYDDLNTKTFEPTRAGAYTPGIQIRNLKKAYSISILSKEKVHALRGVSVDFYKGQITSLLGHNGAGKTTMMSILTGMISPTDGLVLINGKHLKDSASEIMNDMGLCPQVDMYFSSLTVSEQLTFFAMVKRKEKSRAEIRRDVHNLLLKLNLIDKKDALPSTLSGGQKRRLCLGMALVGDSSTLILDEPTSGLDPESRRVIWDILLKMRGEKTILISTHDMEEADILGDQIAIMHTGQLRSYGTSLFLKKMIGQNNVQVTLSIEPQSDPERICRELHRDGVIIHKEASKMVVSIPNTPELPDYLDNLEEKKKSLGISGFSVSLISLEQVFLKMTEEYDGHVKSQQTVSRDERKSTGVALYLQFIRALFAKNLIYALKDYSTILIEIFTVIMALVLTSIILKASTSTNDTSEELIHMSLDKYSHAEVLYAAYDKTIGDQYKTISESDGGNVIESNQTNLDDELLNRARQNINYYDHHMIAAAEFNDTPNGLLANAFYSEKAVYSLPISINLLWNTIVRSILGVHYSISISTQNLPHNRSFNSDLFTSYIYGFSTAIIFVFFFYYAIAMFVVHPSREASTGIKHLQKMSGVSSITYWGTMFFSDLMIFLILVVITIAGFVIMDHALGLNLYGSNEIWIMILLLMLFAINALPLIYIFSFIKTKTNTIVRLLTFLPIGIVALDLILLIVVTLLPSSPMQRMRSIQKGIFLMLPYESFMHNQIILQMTAQINARCKRLPNEYYDSCSSSFDVCCTMQCYNGTCKEYVNFFTHSEGSVSSKDSMIYLYIMPIFFFVILLLLDNQVVQKIIAKCTKSYVPESNTDEQVQRDKLKIAQKIKEFKGELSYVNTDNIVNGRNSYVNNPSYNNQVFLVYELQKSYGSVRAVKDVSFGVNRRECFGLLGVNGAGKSTTFRMMTGGEIPDHGEMYLGDKDFENNEKYFLSQMGYCPQQDALLKCLNSYDHLRLFARLRGIPEKQIEDQVEMWIERLNLTACASQPSGTYSGGNKRRLNIAIALIGSPNLVLMDEPTTGVDPGARRSLWNVIKSCQMAGQAVVLTSHSMEECEALCNRLAIMVDGKLVCIGPSEQLKQRFGAGHDIQIKLDLEKSKMQLASIKSEMPRMLNCVLTDENLGHLMYHVAPTGATWRKMYDVMNEMKSKYDCIDDFLVLSSSLEQLFLLFARTANSNSTAR